MQKDARPSKLSANQKQTYVIDTNAIINDPHILRKLRGQIIVPTTVLRELDKHKYGNTEKARNIREFVRSLKKNKYVYFEKSHHLDGIGDEQILQVAVNIQKNGRKVTLITNDILMSFLARSVNIKTKQHAAGETLSDNRYTGIINHKDIEYLGKYHPNQYVLNKEGLYKFDPSVGLKRLEKDRGVFGIKHKNVEQRCAIDALLDNDVKLVTLSGKAGTGKTLLAIAAGLEKVLNEGLYQKLVVSRPVIPMGNSIGFLPGDLNQKLEPWMQPIFDNIECIFDSEGNRARNSWATLEAQGFLKLEALAYIRGRSIPNQYMIVDEAQNLTKHEIKTIISRVGENTKIILTGDVNQIDNPKLDSVSNGLSYVIEKFKDHKIAAHITLTKCERSELAELAAEIL